MTTDKLSPKQVAQTYFLDEIVLHEVILEAYNELERQVKQHKVPWTRSDIVFKLCNLAVDHEMVPIFSIQKHEILQTVQADYKPEVDELYLMCNT
jgi:hypothetical protein